MKSALPIISLLAFLSLCFTVITCKTIKLKQSQGIVKVANPSGQIKAGIGRSDITVSPGHSMGGYVALKLALKRPELVDRIITLGTKFNWTPEVAAKEVKMLNPDTNMISMAIKRSACSPAPISS